MHLLALINDPFTNKTVVISLVFCHNTAPNNPKHLSIAPVLAFVLFFWLSATLTYVASF